MTPWACTVVQVQADIDQAQKNLVNNLEEDVKLKQDLRSAVAAANKAVDDAQKQASHAPVMPCCVLKRLTSRCLCFCCTTRSFLLIQSDFAQPCTLPAQTLAPKYFLFNLNSPKTCADTILSFAALS